VTRARQGVGKGIKGVEKNPKEREGNELDSDKKKKIVPKLPTMGEG